MGLGTELKAGAKGVTKKGQEVENGPKRAKYKPEQTIQYKEPHRHRPELG